MSKKKNNKIQSEEQKPEFVKKDLESGEMEQLREVKKTKKKEFSFGLDKQKEEKIEKQLSEIYENTDGSMPDMRHFQKKKRSPLIRAFFTVLIASVLFGVVAVVGIFVIGPRNQFAEEDVILSISSTEKITVGQEVTYRIRYRNSQHISLGKAELTVRYPDGFEFVRSSIEPTNDNKDEWALGSLDDNEGGSIDIVGHMYGNIGDKQSLRVFLNYFPSNFNSEFQKVATANTEITESPIELTIDGPDNIIMGSEAEFTVIAKKKDLAALISDQVNIVFDGGQHFSKKNSTPSSEQYKDYEWAWAGTEAEKKVVIRGVFAEGGVGAQDVLVSVIGKHGTKQYTYSTVKQAIEIEKTDVSASVIMNGASGDVAVQPGEKLQSSVVVKNSGSAPLTDMRIRLIYEAPSVDKQSILKWAALDNPSKGDVVGEQINDTMRRGSVTWTKAEVGGLAELASGKEVTVDFMVPVKSGTETDLTEYTNFTGKVFAEVQYMVNGKAEVLTSNSLTITFQSDLTFEIEDDVEINTAGQEVHTVSWLLNNTFHEIKNIELGADIYGDIVWNAAGLVTPAGTATFDEKEKRLVWKVESMPTSVDVLALKFSFTLLSKNPSQTQLTSKVKIQAIDAVTGGQIVKMGDEIGLASN